MIAPIVIRPATANDVNFVLGTWVPSYRSYCPAWLPYDSFFIHFNEFAKKMLQKSTVRIATNPDIPDQIFGWICIDGNRLHYVYVKNRFRRMGIAKKLLTTPKKHYKATLYTKYLKYLINSNLVDRYSPKELKNES